MAQNIGYFTTGVCVFAFTLLSGCSQKDAVEKHVFVDRVDPKDYRLKDDQAELEKLRTQIPEETKAENDESAYLLKMLHNRKVDDLPKARQKFTSDVRKKRERFSTALRKEMEEFQKLQRRQRDTFQKQQNTDRKEAMGLDRDKRKSLFEKLEDDRKEFNDRAKDDSDIFYERRKEKQKTFDEYVKGLQEEFDFEYKAYQKELSEFNKSKALTQPRGTVPLAPSSN